jgi:tRNA threonylcarbamoyladenosine biosynthesis protein TsaB
MPNLDQPLLAFDTATPTARIALVAPSGECLAAREKTASRHSANLLGLVDEVLREGGVRVEGLGAIACGSGPGSFTGLRVGLAVAKGLAFPSARPLVLVSSLDALACDLAAAAPGAQLLLPCLDAGKGQVYSRLYQAEGGPNRLGEGDWVLAPDELCRLVGEVAAGRTLVAGGSGLDRYLDAMRGGLGESVMRPALAGPSAAAIARLARERLGRGEQDAVATAVPRYGRPPDITRPKRRWEPGAGNGGAEPR